MGPEPGMPSLLLLALTGAACLTVGADSLGRRGGLVGMRLVLAVLALSAACANFALLGAALEPHPEGALAWHAVIRACIGFIGGAALGAAYLLVQPHPRRVGPWMLGVGALLAGLGVLLTLRTPPQQFVRTPVSWFPLALPLRLFDTAIIVLAALSVAGAASWRLASGKRYGRRTMVLLLVMESVVAVAYLLIRMRGSPALMQLFGPLLTGATAVIFWATLRRWRAAGLADSAFALLFKSMPVPAVVVDLHTDRALLNPPAHAVLGHELSAPALVRRLGMEGAPEEVLARRAGERIVDVRVESAPGRVFELHVHFDGEHAIGLLLLVDVTERVEHAERLARTLSELRTMQERLVMQEKMAALGVLVAGVNHEISNPLAYASANVRAVQASVGVLLEAIPLARQLGAGAGPELEGLRRWADRPEVRDAEADALPALREAAEGCARIQDIVASLRLLSRQGEAVYPLDLTEVARAGLRVGRTNLQPGVAVAAELERPLPIRGAAGELTRVVTNLVVNAGHALGDNGHLSVRAFEEEGVAVLEVADDGPGVPPHLRARIFEPFFTTKAPGQGTGLGLAISYETARRHGGELRLLDAQRGARFQLRIPLAPDALSATGGGRAAAPPARG